MKAHRAAVKVVLYGEQGEVLDESNFSTDGAALLAYRLTISSELKVATDGKPALSDRFVIEWESR